MTETKLPKCVVCMNDVAPNPTKTWLGLVLHAACEPPLDASPAAIRYAQLAKMPTDTVRDLARLHGIRFTFSYVTGKGTRARAFYHDTYLMGRIVRAELSGEESAEDVKQDDAQIEEKQMAETVTIKSDTKVNTLGIIEARVAEIATEVAAAVAGKAVANIMRVEHYIKTEHETRKIEGRVHRQFDKLLKMCAAGTNVWIAGPAGSGKTTAAHQVAEALKRPFFFNGAIDSEYKLSGFVDAQGRIVSTAFRRAYTEGGVYLFDEVDASLPPALLAFNAALANGHADFPGINEPTPRNPDFVCIAAANTWGLGATSDYVGRNKLDAAFLDRFVSLAWDYDEELERDVAGNDDWTKLIQKYRVAARKRGLKVVISPRASINGARLLAAGMSRDEALDAVIRAKLTAADWSNLVAEVK